LSWVRLEGEVVRMRVGARVTGSVRVRYQGRS
jgi:hypothetical protein